MADTLYKHYAIDPQQGKTGTVLLNGAVNTKNHVLIEELLARGVSPNTQLDVDMGWHFAPALAVAASIDDIESVKLLLRYGANPKQLGSAPKGRDMHEYVAPIASAKSPEMRAILEEASRNWETQTVASGGSAVSAPAVVTPTPAPDASKSQTPLAPAPTAAAIAVSTPVDHPAATAAAQPLPKANDNAEAKKPLVETDTPSSFNISRPPTLKEMSELGKAISKARGLQNSAVAKAIEEYLGQSDGDRKITETEESQAITRLVNAPVLNLSASDQAKVENLVKALAGAGLLDGASAVQPGKKQAKSNER